MFDEQAERRKLIELDITDDVIQIIIDKKRANYMQKIIEEEAKKAVVDEFAQRTSRVDEIPEVEEPTYYPSESFSTIAMEPVINNIIYPVIPEPPMDRGSQRERPDGTTPEPMPSRRRFLWQKK